MASARRRQIASPRPVPPKRRVVDASAWENGSNNPSATFGSIPTPVSVTSKRTTTRSPSGGSANTARKTTSPASVNFTAFVAKLRRI